MAEVKTVLVTGSDHAIHAALAGLLLRRGHRVKILAASLPDIPERAQITPVDGSTASRPQVDAAMRGVDVVVHLAAEGGLNGTQHAIESAFAADVERFIHVSSSAVFAQPRLMPLETAPRNAKSAAGRALIAAEDLVITYRRKGMSVPVLRPQPLVGPFQTANFAAFFAQAASGRASFALNGRGDNHYQLLDVDDFAGAVLAAMTGQRDMVNETYHIGATEYGSIRADLQAVLDHAGGGQVTNRPFAPSPVPGEVITQESAIDVAQAADELGFTPQYSNAQALIRNNAWYAANRHKL